MFSQPSILPQIFCASTTRNKIVAPAPEVNTKMSPYSCEHTTGAPLSDLAPLLRARPAPYPSLNFRGTSSLDRREGLEKTIEILSQALTLVSDDLASSPGRGRRRRSSSHPDGEEAARH
mmetsp:Transcript_21684/g.38755  ORF Transcript_21684/g.38755 Transcript_21684/m.38755 type:complete len:119 (+) Transcript_21684:50-406(+)